MTDAQTVPSAPVPTADASATAEPAAQLTDRPEVLAGAAFAGGFLLAMILKRLG